MLRIFLTADNHIGLKYASHSASKLLSQTRITAFENMVDSANSENCALFVIAGDLFDNTYSIAKKDVTTLVDILSRFKGIVAVLPGNHDYYDKDVKLWQYFKDAISQKDNILLLTEYREYPLELYGEKLVIYPALCSSLHSAAGENNLGFIKKAQIPHDECYRIGIAHGAIEGETIDKEGRYFLMTREELESIPLDLWLIGHTHVPFPAELTDSFTPQGKIFNAGTHVQTDVSCNTRGECFIIELSQDKKITAKKINPSALGFYRLSLSLQADKMTDIIDDALKLIPKESVLELVLSGSVTAQEYSQLDAFMEQRLSGYIEASYNDSALSKLISKEIIAKEFSETSFSASLLYALMDNPKQAQLAYELLKSLEEGK